jgi:hypothetical protein
MRILLLVLFSLLPGCAPVTRVPSSAPPFGTALVVSGENINTPLFIGILDGLEAQGKKVDVIVASCGGSLAAALAQAVPDRDERLRFLTSREYHAKLLGIQMDDPSLFAFAKRLLAMRGQASQQRKRIPEGQRWVPDVFSYSLLHLDESFLSLPELGGGKNFSPTAKYRAVIVAAQVLFPSADSGAFAPAEKKLFRETFFTDVDTASYLEGLPSFVGENDPASSLAPDTQVYTQLTLAEAARASITDPLLVNPPSLRGAYYLTGAVNIDPINVAKRLAREVVARYPTAYDSAIEQPALMAAFAFDGNAIREKALAQDVDYWVDGTAGFPSMALGPQPNILGALKHFNPGRTYKFGSKVPATYEDFVKLVREQYEAGFRSAQEALRASRGDVSHIKKPLR